MPTILYRNGFRFFFYSSEGNEPAHIHVTKGDANAKIWLEPMTEKAYMHGFSLGEEKVIMNLVKENVGIFKERWYEYFN